MIWVIWAVVISLLVIKTVRDVSDLRANDVSIFAQGERNRHSLDMFRKALAQRASAKRD